MKINDCHILGIKPHSLHSKKNFNTMPINHFCSNMDANNDTFQASDEELSKVLNIKNNVKQLELIFQAAGKHVTGLFKEGIPFLIPLGNKNFAIKDVLKTEEIPAINIEYDSSEDTQDEMLKFGLKNSENDDIAQIIISNTGEANIVQSKNSQNDYNKYLSEINKNHDKFFNAVCEATDDAVNIIGEILCSNEIPEFDLTSKEDVQKYINQFLEEKKRIPLLVKISGNNTFWDEFKFENPENKSITKGILPGKNLPFSFSLQENKYFEGMAITVTDDNKGTKQGFVAKNTGEIYKTKIYPKDAFTTQIAWRVSGLTLLTEKELENPDLKYMFNYGCTITDKAYKCLLKIFHDKTKRARENAHTQTLKIQSRNEALEAKRIAQIYEYNKQAEIKNSKKAEIANTTQTQSILSNETKVIKIFDLSVKEFKMINDIVDLNDRITAAYERTHWERRQDLIDKAGIIRRKGKYGIIFDDLLTNDKYKLGISRYVSSEDTPELISFGVYDNNLNEIARIKISKNGKARLTIRPETPTAKGEEIEKIIKNEMAHKLQNKLLSRLDTICYYHENKVKVDNYIAKAYHTLSVEDAIKELKKPPRYYNFGTYKIRQLKRNWEAVRTTYREHPEQCYSWQKYFYPDVKSNSKKYMYGQLEDPKINYEFILIDNENLSGARILTKDDNGKFENGYIIDMQGNTYKIIMLPKNNLYSNINVEMPNLTQLDENAIKQEHLDEIFEKICKDTSEYINFLEDCLNRVSERSSGRLPRRFVEEKVAQHKSGNVQNETTQAQAELLRKKKYSNILNEDGEFQPLNEINLKYLVKHLDNIFAKPYEERSPHLIHEILPDGRIFPARFSIIAPDGAKVTVSKLRANEFLDFLYYAIKVQREQNTMYIAIHPDKFEILRCDKNNKLQKDDTGEKLIINRETFIAHNPLSQNMPLYLSEIFAEKTNMEKQVVKFQSVKTNAEKLKAQKIRDFNSALHNNLKLNIEEEENKI